MTTNAPDVILSEFLFHSGGLNVQWFFSLVYRSGYSIIIILIHSLERYYYIAGRKTAVVFSLRGRGRLLDGYTFGLASHFPAVPTLLPRRSTGLLERPRHFRCSRPFSCFSIIAIYRISCSPTGSSGAGAFLSTNRRRRAPPHFFFPESDSDQSPNSE